MTTYHRGEINSEGLENRGAPWRDSEVQQLLKEIKDNISFEDIAKAHKRTESGIRSRLRVIAYDKYKENMSINNIVALTRLPKDDVIDSINKREYAEGKKAERGKTQTKLTFREEPQVLAKVLHPKNEVSELQEILKTLKSLEVRVTEYIKERAIFDD